MKNLRLSTLAGAVLAAGAVALLVETEACAQPKTLSGAIKVDGSSTVFPISEAVAEEFRGQVSEKVRVTVGISGTGGGFKKFCAGELDISNASRPIKASEAKACSQKNVEYIELPVAYDGLSVLVNPSNSFVASLTVEELTKIWKLGGPTKWNEVRPEWPDRKIDLYGAGTDSGTFDYFVEAIVPPPGKIRPDFTASEDDNVLVQGIAGDPDALGFFGYAYYLENKDKLKAVAIDGGKGPVLPSPETVTGGTYQPLSRPIFIYVRRAAADRPEVQEFTAFYLKNAAKLVKDVGYIPLPEKAYQLALKRFQERKTGTVFKGAEVGVTVESLLAREE